MAAAADAGRQSFWRRGDREVSLARLYAIRAVGLLGIYGLLPVIESLFAHEPTARGMTNAMVSGLWVMCFLTVRYPLKMLPILLFELVWKVIWLVFFGLPQWSSGVGSPKLADDLWSIGAFPIVCVLVIPWGYVWRHYVQAPGDRWR